MKLSDTVFSALNTGKNILMNNIQVVHPGQAYDAIKNMNSPTENFFADASGTGLDISGGIAKLSSTFSSWTSSVKKDASENVVSAPTEAPKESVIKKVVSILLTITYILICLLLASLVANQMIMHPWSMRLIGFLLTLVLTIVNPFILISVAGYYIFFVLHRVFYNSNIRTYNTKVKEKDIKAGKQTDPKTLKPLKSYLPYIFTLLPLTTSKATTTLGYIFMYMFAYELPEDLPALQIERNNWLAMIQESFPNWSATIAIPKFKELYDDFVGHLGEMHSYKEKVEMKGADGKMVTTFVDRIPFIQDGSSYSKNSQPIENKQEKAANTQEKAANTQEKAANTQEKPVNNQEKPENAPPANAQPVNTPPANVPPAPIEISETIPVEQEQEKAEE